MSFMESREEREKHERGFDAKKVGGKGIRIISLIFFQGVILKF